MKSNNMPGIYPIPKSACMVQWTQLNNILLEIYDCFADHGQAPWEQLSLSADQSGKFRVNYFYDVMNEKDGGQLVRELLWARDIPSELKGRKEYLPCFSAAAACGGEKNG